MAGRCPSDSGLQLLAGDDGEEKGEADCAGCVARYGHGPAALMEATTAGGTA